MKFFSIFNNASRDRTLAETLIAEFRDFGARWVTAIEHELPRGGFTVWVLVGSDRQRDALQAHDSLAADTKRIMKTAGFTAAQIDISDVQVQSQQTVDRDFGGNVWSMLAPDRTKGLREKLADDNSEHGFL